MHVLILKLVTKNLCYRLSKSYSKSYSSTMHNASNIQTIIFLLLQGFNEKCEFRVRPVGSVEGSVVCLESVAQPGRFVGMLPNGSTFNSKSLVPTSREAQFRVRAFVRTCTTTLQLFIYMYSVN